MPYEQDKDKVIEDLGAVPNSPFVAEVRQYDGGPAKLCVSRVMGKDGTKRRQLFRLPYEEVVELGEFLVEFSATHGVGSAADNDIDAAIAELEVF